MGVGDGAELRFTDEVEGGLEEGLLADFSAEDQIGEVIPWTLRDGKKDYYLSLGNPVFLRLAKIALKRYLIGSLFPRT